MKIFRKSQVKGIFTLGGCLLGIASIQSCQKNYSNAPKPLEFNGSMDSFSAAAVPATISQGLVAYWPLANSIYDFSGNRHNGTPHAVTATTDRFGNANGAYSFNGTSSYITIPDTLALRLSSTDFTLNAWVYLTSYNSSLGSDILSKRFSGANNGWNWAIAGAKSTPEGIVSYSPGGGNNSAVGITPVSLNNWHMVTSIYVAAGKKLKIYVDGVLDTIATNISSANSLITAELCIGRDNPALEGDDNGYFFHGSLSDIRIYSRAINNTELHRLYAATTAPTWGLVAYWPLTRTPNDLSGNKHNGTSNMVIATTDRFGNPVGAYNFNGTSSFIAVPDSASLRLANTDFTINAWVKLISYDAALNSDILSKRLALTNNGWNLGVAGATGTTQGAVSFSTSGNATGTTALDLNNWHMVTCSYTLATKQLKIYVDGVFNKTVVNISSPNATTDAMLYIGRDNPALSGDGSFFHGGLNDIRIYNRGLSNNEINQLYNALN